MGYIKREFIDKILEITNLEDVIRDFVELKREGANLKGKSPFSDEKTPSFIVSPSKNIWKDFSSGKGGNVLTFLIEKGYTFVKAIEYLANKYNENVEYENPQIAEKKAKEVEEVEDLRKTLKAVHSSYMKAYFNLAKEHDARKEVEEHRQYSKEDIIEWGIGYAPENYLYEKLYNSGTVENGFSLGLIKKGNNNHKYDVYTNRVIYPIHDEYGQIIGLAGRKLTKDDKYAKWINPSVNDQNKLYNKSKVLYGLHKAKQHIRKENLCYIVEGYNDVIAFHKYGVTNTVAPCGTAITLSQIRIIKRLTDKIVFCLDPDDAGTRAVLKQIPIFLENGFRTEVLHLPQDPDDFSRMNIEEINKKGLKEIIENDYQRIDGFKFLMSDEIKGSEVDKSAAAQKLCEIINNINDSALRETYIPWLAKESGVKASVIRKWIKELQKEKEEKEASETKIPFYTFQYELPKGVTANIDELAPKINSYGMFMSNNQIFFALESTDEVVRFRSISNFSIEVLQHMEDEKFPKKLIRVQNTHNKCVIFDTDSNSLNTLQKFDDTLTNHGNFRFDGNNKDLKILRRYLMDNMGNGQKVDVLGWQPEARIWIWNNAVLYADGSEIYMDENGIVVQNKAHYYVPSANKIYTGTKTKYLK